MSCPRCGAPNLPGALLCTECNEVLDPQALIAGDDLPVAGEATLVGPAPTADDRGSAARNAARRRRGWDAARDAAPEPTADAGVPLPLQETGDAPPPDPLAETARSLEELRDLFFNLARSDQWAAGSAMLLCASLLFPWRWARAEQEVIGLVAAWPTALSAAAALALLYRRVRGGPGHHGTHLLLGQLAAALLACADAGATIQASSHVRAVQAAGQLVAFAHSRPEPASFFGLACGVVLLLASLVAVPGRA